MRKKRLLTGALAATAISALPVMALLPANRNALGNAPVMKEGFQKPPVQEGSLKGDMLKKGESEETKKTSAPRKTAPEGVELPGIVASVYDYATNTIGMYKLPEVSGGEMEPVNADVSSYYGGALAGDIYYACDDGRFEEYWETSDPHGYRLQAYNVNSWEKVGDPVSLATYRADCLAIHPVTGKGYAYGDYGSLMYHLYEIDLATGQETDLTPSAYFIADENVRAIAFDSDGTLYGVNAGGEFGTVSLETGLVTRISKLPLGSFDRQHGNSATFDPETGKFLLMYNGSPDWNTTHVSELYSIDPQTGEYTLLADFTGKCITSMFVKSEPVADKAPGVPSEPVGSFEDGSLSGTVTFTMPTAYHDGSEASGTAAWTVSDGKETVATGTAGYGQEVVAEVTVAAPGKHSFNVTASNDAGTGKASRLSMWVGPDTPKAPANIKVEFDEPANRFSISWDAVTQGANGGYVDPEAVTYTVVRVPAQETVAENISGTSAEVVYEPQGIESVSFSVTARQGELVSAPGMSDPIMTGSMELPYDLSLVDVYRALDNWTVIDVNEDGRTWGTGYNGVSYSYSSANAADDWMITPPIKALNGCKYKVHVKFRASSSSFMERAEVKWGYAPTAAGMEIAGMSPADVDGEGVSYDFEVIPDRDGKLFIGMHAISDADKYNLILDELTISAPVNETAPAAPVVTVVTADPAGALRVTGKVLAPSRAENGTSLTGISRMEVTRDGVVVATVENVTPGSTVDFTDETVASDSECTYCAYAYNGDLKSLVSEPYKTFVGVNRPGEVGGVRIARSAENPSEIEVTWDSASTDWQGYPLNGEVKYQVEVYPDNAYYHGNKTYTDIEGNSCRLVPTFETGRDHGFVYVKVSAVNTAGIGYGYKSDNIYAGKALTVPFRESFPNYTLEHPWGDGLSNGPQIASITDDERSLALQQYNGWNRLMDASFTDGNGASQDHDNGLAGMFGWSYVADEAGNYHNEWTELFSPVIDLTGIDSPMLTFYTYNWLTNGRPDTNILDVDVVTPDGQRHSAFHSQISELGDVAGWERVAIDLSRYAGQEISLIFKGTIVSTDEYGYNWVLIDNINIDRVAAVDIQAGEIEGPVQAKPGESFNVSAMAYNLGTSDVACKATLYHNGSEVASKDMGVVAASRSARVEFGSALSVQDPIGNAFRITFSAEGDEDTGNNTTSDVTVARNMQLLPEPEKVYVNPGGARLEWSEPDYSAAVPAAVTEDFESYPVLEQESFLTQAGDWIFIDVDEAPIGGMVSSSTMEIMEFPGIPTHSEQSWWVQSRLFEEFNDGYYGHDSSLQYLANMYVVNDAFNAAVQQDDWAITPELCGREQLVTLWARSYNRSTPETVEFLYSEGGTTPDAFRLIKRVDELPGDWTQYALVVPEGGRRLAIRGCSYMATGTAQTFIDDVTFYPATGSAQDLDLKGYNVYCDDALINSEPVRELEYIQLPEGSHTYAVSAVYATGESRAVKAVEGSGVGLDALGSVKVSVKDGSILIDNLSGAAYSVVSSTGVVIAHGEGEDAVSIPASQGIWMVTVKGRTVKVAVR